MNPLEIFPDRDYIPPMHKTKSNMDIMKSIRVVVNHRNSAEAFKSVGKVLSSSKQFEEALEFLKDVENWQVLAEIGSGVTYHY